MVKERKPKQQKENKKPKKVKKEGYFKKLQKEIKLVKWPSFKEVAKYTISTLVFCILICLFFILLNFIMSVIKGMFV